MLLCYRSYRSGTRRKESCREKSYFLRSPKISPKKEMWALSVPRTMFSGKVKVIVSEAEVPANGKSISTATCRREIAEPQASPGDGVKKAGITSSVLK